MSQTEHRPWPVPRGPWVMAQSWHDLLFAHWPVPPDMLRPLIPASLPLDTFDGAAWVGVVPFRMSGVRPRSIPSVPWLSSFAELNLRTYVKGSDGDKPGVWFFCLEAANPVAVEIARRVFRLPYFNARMKVQRDGAGIMYRSRRIDRRGRPAEFHASYSPVGPVMLARPGSIEHWLTERYCLYTTNRQGRAYRGEIHHAQWPLQPAVATIERNTLPDAHEIRLPDQPPLLHFARRLDVVVWPLRRVSQQ